MKKKIDDTTTKQPVKTTRHRLVLKIPVKLHDQLARMAKEQGTTRGEMFNGLLIQAINEVRGKLEAGTIPMNRRRAVGRAVSTPLLLDLR